MEPTITLLYGATLVGLAYFGFHRLKMLGLYWRSPETAPPHAPPEDWAPSVCVQLPVYNEAAVVEALLDHVSALRWRGPLEIQILDDSTDETSALIERWRLNHPRAALRMVHLRRPVRSGYKAGALAQGMARTRAEYFAILDADFRPAPDFIEALMPHFMAQDVAAVQARWEFANRRQSLLTRFQAVFLDAHFIIEQRARAAAGLWFNFNGTAGIWRRTAIVAAGGWSSDTVTEDLDISYRAQLAGWRLVYRDDYAVPSELPDNVIAFKSQQRRWTKGGLQVARKLAGRVWRAEVPARIKREALQHLSIGLVHPLLVLFSLLFVPYLWISARQAGTWWYWTNPAIVLLAGGAPVMFYVAGQFLRRREWRALAGWWLVSPLLLALGLALSITLAVAAVEGLCRRGGEFVRTPKGGYSPRAGGLLQRVRSRRFYTSITTCEVVLGGGMLMAAAWFWHEGSGELAPALVLKAVGFLLVAALSLDELWAARTPAMAVPPDRI